MRQVHDYTIMDTFLKNQFQCISMAVHAINNNEIALINEIEKQSPISAGDYQMLTEKMTNLTFSNADGKYTLITIYNEGRPFPTFIKNFRLDSAAKRELFERILDKISHYDGLPNALLALLIDENQIIIADDDVLLNEIINLDKYDEQVSFHEPLKIIIEKLFDLLNSPAESDLLAYVNSDQFYLQDSLRNVIDNLKQQVFKPTTTESGAVSGDDDSATRAQQDEDEITVFAQLNENRTAKTESEDDQEIEPALSELLQFDRTAPIVEKDDDVILLAGETPTETQDDDVILLAGATVESDDQMSSSAPLDDADVKTESVDDSVNKEIIAPTDRQSEPALSEGDLAETTPDDLEGESLVDYRQRVYGKQSGIGDEVQSETREQIEDDECSPQPEATQVIEADDVRTDFAKAETVQPDESQSDTIIEDDAATAHATTSQAAPSRDQVPDLDFYFPIRKRDTAKEPAPPKAAETSAKKMRPARSRAQRRRRLIWLIVVISIIVLFKLLWPQTNTATGWQPLNDHRAAPATRCCQQVNDWHCPLSVPQI